MNNSGQSGKTDQTESDLQTYRLPQPTEPAQPVQPSASAPVATQVTAPAQPVIPPTQTQTQPIQNINQASNLQQQAAASIVRRKVIASYTNNIPKNSANLGRLKETPSQIDSESWRRYHTAWQDYYQKYYNDYYSNAARNYIQKEQLKEARAKAEEIAAAPSKPETKIRSKIRQKATNNAKKSRRNRRFIPILAGISVVLVILFLQYNRLIFAPIMAYVSPGNAPASSIDAIDPTVTRTVSPEPKLLIPKINVDVPIVFGVKTTDTMAAMREGVAHYSIAGADALPGQIGNLVITGHSAGDIYSSNQYKYIFSGLERLEVGDLIYVNYESVRYTYSVTKKDVIEPTNVGALIFETDKPIITLVTCTPLGTSRYRLLVFGEQISPSFENAKSIDRPTNITPTEETLPANSPSFFEGLWGLF